MHPGRLLSYHGIEANFFEGKDEFLGFTVDGFNGVPGNIKLDSQVSVDISIDEIPLLNPGDSRKIFNGMFWAVEEVIRYFEDWHE
jgi:hypothetical protein